MKISSRFRWLPLLAVGLCATIPARAANVIAIGDSLTAEYEIIPEVPGFSREATAYAEVTVKGWESLSWVEVLARVQRAQFNFGGSKKWPDVWSVPRLTGYEYNWGIPGIMAGQYEDFVTSSAWSNFLRQPLEDQLKKKAQRVVVWLGTNEFRAAYGRIYDGGSSTSLIDGLLDDLGRIVDFVKKKNSKLQIVVAAIPDVGAAPDKQQAHPNPLLRARVTAAIVEANQRIAKLAAKKGAGYADTFDRTARLIRGEPLYFGAVEIINDLEEDNDPHYAFTRDGLHPNTPLQIENARAITRAFNAKFAAGIPLITDAQALTLLGISANEPYYDWLASFGFTDKLFITDEDGDGLTRLVEFTFGLDPTVSEVSPVTIVTFPNLPGQILADYLPAAAGARYVRAQPQWSIDRVTWRDLAVARIRKVGGAVSATFLATEGPFHRLKVSTIPPSGSMVSIFSTLPLE
ncbi:MAG: SGNH/GDSL hydrolase family protein [Chthoniobacteraceae bacterium]